jgi:hypothetical protein
MAASYRFDLLVSLVRLIVVRRFFFTLAQQRAGSAFQFRQLVAHHVPDFFVIEAEIVVCDDVPETGNAAPVYAGP